MLSYIPAWGERAEEPVFAASYSVQEGEESAGLALEGIGLRSCYTTCCKTVEEALEICIPVRLDMLLALFGHLLVLVDEEGAPEFGFAGALAEDSASAVRFYVFGAADDLVHWVGRGRGAGGKGIGMGYIRLEIYWG